MIEILTGRGGGSFEFRAVERIGEVVFRDARFYVDAVGRFVWFRVRIVFESFLLLRFRIKFFLVLVGGRCYIW